MAELFNIIDFLKSAVASGVSDEHLTVGEPPFVRKNGEMRRVAGKDPLTRAEITNALLALAPATLLPTFNTEKDIDFVYEIPGLSRFRVNYSRECGDPACVIRNIPFKIPTLEELKLPEVLKNFTKMHNGIILVTGPTGSGKSTTLASLISEINNTQAKHIITIEEPIEYMFPSKKSRVSQRQIGMDTSCFEDGIKYSLRQDPDVIFIGEIRDKETMQAALKAAETGHLVLSTLHTNDAIQTINRVINMFDEQNRHIIRRQLSECLRATVAQKLIFSEKHKKRFPALEIMIMTSTIKDYMQKDNIEEIYNIIRTNTDGMISLNKSLSNLVQAGFISKEEALNSTDDENELSKLLRGAYTGSGQV